MMDVLLMLLIIFMAIAPVQSFGLDAAVTRNSTDTHPSETENPVVSGNRGQWILLAQFGDCRSVVTARAPHRRVKRRGQRLLYLNIERVALIPR
jgi:biopolymer transport protein ExbD